MKHTLTVLIAILFVLSNAYGDEQPTNSEEKKISNEIPIAMCGTWNVVSFDDLKGEAGTGNQLDVWQIKPESINFGEAGTLQVRDVHARIEPNQDLHVITFVDNGLQCVFIRSNTFHDTYQVVQYLNGGPRMKCLLTQKTIKELKNMAKEARKNKAK